MHVCTNGRTPKSYNHVWSGHDGKGCVFGCGLCSGMYCDTYVFMYMNMQNMFELSLQALLRPKGALMRSRVKLKRKKRTRCICSAQDIQNLPK